MNIPEADLISGMQTPFPYVIVADDAFPLKISVKTIQSNRTNSRQEDIQLQTESSTASCRECFGILANRFHIDTNSIHIDTN